MTLIWLLWPVLGTPFLADDIANSQRSAGLAAANESLFEFTIRLTHQWIRNEGRFFPVSVFENVLVFDTVHSRFVYKLLEITMVCLLAFSLALLVWLMTRRWALAVLSFFFFCVALQVRYWYDPTISFGVLLPSTGIKALGALCCVVLAMRREKKWEFYSLLAISASLWFLALMQYEIVLLLGVIAFFIVLHENSVAWQRRLTAFLSIAMPSAVFLLISRMIRSGVTASPAYETNFRIVDVARALKFQLLGAVPLSVPFSQVDKRVGVIGATANLSIAHIGFSITTIGAIAYVICQLDYPPLRTRLFLIATAIALFILPAVPTTLSVRWQNELGPGHAYLPVMLQYLGTALLLLAISIEIKECTQRIIRALHQNRRLLTTLVATGIALASVCTIYTNRAGIEYTSDSYIGFRIDREIFEAATKQGLLNSSLANGVLLSPNYDPSLWMNRDYVTWLGGPSIARFGRPKDLVACQAAADRECLKLIGGMLIVDHTKDGSATALVATLQNWWTVPTAVNEIRSISAIAGRREDLLCGQSEAVFRDDWWTTSCSMIDEILLQKIQAQYTS